MTSERGRRSALFTGSAVRSFSTGTITLVRKQAAAHLHELIVEDCVRVRAGCIQELFQALSWSIVHTVCAQDIESFQAQMLLHRPQCLHLH